jgi:hypothetical protein
MHHDRLGGGAERFSGECRRTRLCPTQSGQADRLAHIAYRTVEIDGVRTFYDDAARELLERFHTLPTAD